MYNGARIIVANGEVVSSGSVKGGELIIDGGMITSGCSDFWSGIEVWGHSSYHQYSFDGNYYQGRLTLKNGAKIQNANIAILVGGYQSNGNFDPAKGGGIVQVLGNNSMEYPSAIIKNNRWGVRFEPYQNWNPNEPYDKKPNRSYFYNTNFEVNSDFYDGNWDKNHVSLYSVDGITFKGCTFTNETTSQFEGTGILGATGPGENGNVGFHVAAICTSGMSPCPENSLDRCRFNYLEKGIKVSNTGIYTISVKDAIFESNSIGIEMTNVNNATVLFSDFYIGQPSEEEQQECGGKASAYGIYMDNCTGFAIEENEFYKATGAPTGNYVGIRVAETNAVDEIYNNYFEGLSFANYTEGKNWLVDQIYQGLAFICNENSDNYRDIDIEQNPEGIGGVQAFQGSTEMPAGNRFSPTGANYHIYNNGAYPIVYYYQQGLTGAYPDPIYNVGREAVAIENECLSHYGGGGSGGDDDRLVLSDDEKLVVEQEYLSSLNNYNSVKGLYDNLTDGGSTEELITDVETAWPEDMWELRAELLGSSPHLSMEVLKEAADKTDVLPESVLFEILSANPDELKKEELLTYLEDKDNPLPAYMIEILRQLSYGITYKTVLQQQMANYSLVKTRAAHDMIRSIQNDTVTNLPALRNWLDNLGGIRADQQIVTTYLTEGNYTDAIALAGMMPALYDLDGYNLDEHNYYLELLNFKIGLYQLGRSLGDLTPAELAQLNTIAQNSPGVAGAEARGILESGYGYSFCDCINVEDNQGYKSTMIDPSFLSKAYGLKVTVDPNPAKNWTAFSYTIPDFESKGTIKIVDVTGKVIQVVEVEGHMGQYIWDTRGIPSGVYMYTFTVNGMVSSDKIVIQK